MLPLTISITKAQSPYEISAPEYVDKLMTCDLEQYARHELLLQISAHELATEMLSRLCLRHGIMLPLEMWEQGHLAKGNGGGC
jgi:hypothetical protein